MARRDIRKNFNLIIFQLNEQGVNETLLSTAKSSFFQMRRGPFYYQIEPLAKVPTISDWQRGTGNWHSAWLPDVLPLSVIGIGFVGGEQGWQYATDTDCGEAAC